MRGYNVLHPTGFDAFGLPAQQYALEKGIHPRVSTSENIATMTRQMKAAGFSYDWSRVLATTDPKYYRWTQWIFLKLFNSWYDGDADAARPIRELVNKLESGQLVVDLGGNVIPAPLLANSPSFLTGTPGGYLHFYELQPDQQRRLIDEYRLAYMAEVPVNWCPKLGTVLANEEVTNEGRSERGDHPVYRRAMKQWMLRITAYVERLLEDLDSLDWPEPIKVMQRNWIGKSVGAEVDFLVEPQGGTPGHSLKSRATEEDEFFTGRGSAGFPSDPGSDVIRVYTTRPDTLFGATYMVLAPEHPLVEEITTGPRRRAVMEYVKQAVNKTELERLAETKDKTGVFTGAYAINPVNRQPIPIWVADYVMMGYGTGAIMAVPAHDTRDFEFATKFNLPIVQVVQPPAGVDWRGYVGDGLAVNSGPYDGMSTADFKKRITADLEKAGLGRAAVNYKIRDWVFSRQWYWGEPFPIVHCDKCGAVGLRENQLPLVLPEMEDFTPAASDDPDAPPQPPLGRAGEWTKTSCPVCGGPAQRELNTMPQWAGSCWYYLRFLDPANDKAFCDPKVERYWMKGRAKGDTRQAAMGVDLYVGGAEHAVLHLLYARFWHKVLYDLGYVSTPEPFGRLFNQGMIRSFAYRDRRGAYVAYQDVDLSGDRPRHRQTGEELAESVEKMSKSLKNVVNPDDVIAQYGADSFRLYEMFMGPLEASKPWNTRDVPGVHRFLHRVWRMVCGSEEPPPAATKHSGDPDHLALLREGEAPEEVERALHKLIRKVGADIDAMKFNTAIAAMMDFVNTVYRAGAVSADQAGRFVLVLSPFAPHLGEELWQRLGAKGSLAHEPWPAYDEKMLAQETIELPVQVNGKLRGRITVAPEAARDEVIAAALAEPKVAAAVQGKTVVRKIVVPGKLVNFVVK
jgi:leucyl-tRNA synthetase